MATSAQVALLSAQQNPYPGATLALDFIGARTNSVPYYSLNGVLYPVFASLPGLTVSRASVGYAERQDGTLVQFGNNVARITDKGLLVEESRTNVLPNSIFQGSTGAGVFPTGWSVTGTQGTTISTAAGTVLGVTTNIVSHRRIGAGGIEGMQNGGTGLGLTTGTAYTFSAYFRVPTGVTAEDANVYFGTGTPTQATIVTAATLNAQPKDVWVRYSVTITFTVAPSVVSFANANPASIGNGWDIALPQVETGSFVLSFIPTTGASATRAADSVSVGGRTYNYPMTIVGEFNTPAAGLASSARVLASGNTLPFLGVDSTSHGTESIRAVLGLATTANTYAAGTTGKLAARFLDSNNGIALNGGTVATNAGAIGAGGNTGTWGLGYDNVSSDSYLNGYLRRLLTYPRAFSDAELQAASQ